MAAITREEIAQVALLSRLAFDEEGMDRMVREIGGILDYVRQLQQVDVSGVEPTSHTLRLVNVLRRDDPLPSLVRDDALANAPDQAEGCFRVPPVLQGLAGS